MGTAPVVREEYGLYLGAPHKIVKNIVQRTNRDKATVCSTAGGSVSDSDAIPETNYSS